MKGVRTTVDEVGNIREKITELRSEMYRGKTDNRREALQSSVLAPGKSNTRCEIHPITNMSQVHTSIRKTF